jgi:hypothetical protein
MLWKRKKVVKFGVSQGYVWGEGRYVCGEAGDAWAEAGICFLVEVGVCLRVRQRYVWGKAYLSFRISV